MSNHGISFDEEEVALTLAGALWDEWHCRGCQKPIVTGDGCKPAIEMMGDNKRDLVYAYRVSLFCSVCVLTQEHELVREAFGDD